MPNFIPIPGPSDDARAVRTRDAVVSALIALMQERSYDDIQVQDICSRAAIGRSTFYAHFQDKDDIFIRATVVFARTLGCQLQWDEHRGYRFPVAFFFDHVRQMHGLFESLAKARKTAFIMTILQNNLAAEFESRIAQFRAASDRALPAEILGQHLAGTLFTLLNWWQSHHQPCSPAAMQTHWEQLVGGLG